MASISDTNAPVALVERPIAPAHANSRRAPGTGGSLLRAALRMALVLMIGIGVLRFVSDVWQIVHEANGGYDFLCYYAAALVLRDHPTANFYDPHVLQMAALAHHAPIPGLLYMYPPLLAIMLIPLTWLPWHVALSVWTAFSLALWLACAALSAVTLRSFLREARPGMGVSWVGADGWLFLLAVVAFMTLTFDPVATGIGLGQISIVIWFLILLALALDQWGHPGLAGAALGLAALLKVYPLVLLGYYVLRGRWRVALGGVVTLALLTLGMLPVLGAQGLLVTRGIFAAGDTAIVEAHNEALLRTPLWVAILGGGGTHTPVSVPGAALVALVALAFVGGILWATRPLVIFQWPPVHALLARLGVPLAVAGAKPVSRVETREDRSRRSSDTSGYLWAICTMMLVSPVAWEHAYCWLLPPLVLGLGYVLVKGRGTPRHSALLLAVIILSYALTCADYPLGYDIFKQYMLGPVIWGHPLRPFFMIARPFGALLLWGAMGWLFFAASRAASSGQRLEAAPLASEPSHGTPRRRAVVLIGLLGSMEVMRIAIITVMVLFGAAYGPTALLR